ncbi:hypothetical protein [Agrobacterium vitis]|uniref:hypothetical protein n=1 Tax=Agrobacterium vitis TaxID=373 RepID=UPI0008DBF968|nr:hypothetical protein [Agrobacterium vitis]MUO85572.1 hypothetical protein [Agrobacterium vitis]
MPVTNAAIYSVNGGEVGEEALSRLDLERMQFSGALYENILPRVVGSMTVRPGMEHLMNNTLGEVMFLEYAYGGADTYTPVLSNLAMRILKNGSFISRVAVSTAITNGDFNSFTGWTNASTGTSTASVDSGTLALIGFGNGRASAKQTIGVSGGDQGKVHGLRIKVKWGTVIVNLGTASGGTDLINGISLPPGDHSIAFIPTGSNVYVELYHDTRRNVYVESCTIDVAGQLALVTPWTGDDLAANIIRYDQSNGVIYVASGSYQQREIKQIDDSGLSWGIARYESDDGPFKLYDGSITLRPGSYFNFQTLTASQDFFRAGMVGRLFRLTQSGQAVNENFASSDVQGDYIRISGVEGARKFNYSISGTFSATIWLQRSVDDGSGNPTGWVDISSFTGAASGDYTDSDDNVIKYFRFVVKSGGYTSGTAVTSLTYSGGSNTGIARVVQINSPTEAGIDIISRFYSLDATADWDYSYWSDYDGWPTGVQVFGGRVFWGTGDMGNGSISDDYKSFDDTEEGDSAPIARSFGCNSRKGVLWFLGLQRLIVGTDVAEISVKSSSFDEALTVTNWFPVNASTKGCYGIRAVKCDTDGVFIDATGVGVFRLTWAQNGTDYTSTDLLALHEDLFDNSPVVDIAVQRRPDTVIWFILENGEARTLTYSPSDQVLGWARVLTDGLIKRVGVVRKLEQDTVLFDVERNGTKRFEQLAMLKECRGGAVQCLADGFTRFTTSATEFAVPHLDGLDVTVWANGAAIHDQNNLYTVTDGKVVLTEAKTNVVIGLPYRGRWKTTKLAYGAGGGTALFMRKKVPLLGLALVNTMMDGLRIGKDFDTLRRLTVTSKGKPLAANTLLSTYDADLTSISSDWDTDSRVCIEHKTPYPMTTASLVMNVETNG